MVVAAATELATFKRGYPADWSLVIVCNDVAWKALLQVADQRSTQTAFTILEKKHTIIRGDIFNLRRSDYRHTLAHELGHILGACDSEQVANALAREIES